MKVIPLTPFGEAVVDDRDYARLSRHVWTRHPKGHAQRVTTRNGRVVTIYMHRDILGVTDPKVQVDHRDRNKLNNRRKNLRAATNGQNQMNRAKLAAAASRFKGVTFKPRNIGKPWLARISHDRRRVHLGYFATEREAAVAYNRAAAKLFGRFARLNQV